MQLSHRTHISSDFPFTFIFASLALVPNLDGPTLPLLDSTTLCIKRKSRRWRKRTLLKSKSLIVAINANSSLLDLSKQEETVNRGTGTNSSQSLTGKELRAIDRQRSR